MQIGKRIIAMVFVACLAAAVLMVPDAEAYAQAAITPKKVTVSEGSISYASIRVDYSKGDAQLKNIKSSSPNLIARQTRQYCSEYSDSNYAEIGLYAKKAGSYRVTFDVCDANGNKVSSHKVKVKAVKRNSDYTYPIKEVTFAGKQFSYELLTPKKKGKFRVALNKGYKLKSIEMEYYDADGRSQRKTVKNNADVALGLYTYKREYSYSRYDGDDWYYSFYTRLFAETNFYVAVQDKKSKQITTYIFRVCRTPLN